MHIQLHEANASILPNPQAERHIETSKQQTTLIKSINHFRTTVLTGMQHKGKNASVRN